MTGIIPTNHKVECCVEWTKYINENHAFGTYNPSNAMLAAQSMHFTTYSNKYYWGTDGTAEHNGGSFKTGVHTIVFNEDDGNGGYQVTLNGTVIDNVKTSGTTEIVLFGRGNTVNFSGYLHYFKIWDLDTGELLAHYVPCYEKGIHGLYDKVANKMVKVASGMTCEGETVDYTKYWEQVDMQPAPASWPEYDCPIVVVSCRLIDDISEPRYIRSSESAGKEILEKLTDLYNKGVTLFLLRILTPDQQHIGYLDALMAFEGATVGINKFELPKFFEAYKYLMPNIESYMSISNGQVVANGNGYVIRIKDWMIDRYYQLAAKSDLNSYAPTSTVLSKTNTGSYTPTSNYHPATKKYVDDTINNYDYVTPLMKNTYLKPTGTYDVYENYYTFENLSTDYTFELNDNGFYESNCKGVTNGYAVCKLTFNVPVDTPITITAISNGENTYDYGIFSKIDTELAVSNAVDDSSKIFKNFNGLSSTNEVPVTYDVPAGSHFIYIKYRKDSSGNTGKDSLQFKLPAQLEVERYADFTFASEEYVNNATSSVKSNIVTVDISSMNETETILSAEHIQLFQDAINGYWKETGEMPMLCVIHKIYQNDKKKDYYVFYKFANGLMEYHQLVTASTGSSEYYFNARYLKFSGYLSSETNEYKFSSGSYNSANGSQVYLSKYNSKEYTPTSNYHPATKKYVDDAVANAGGGTITETDPTVPDWAKQPSKPTYTASEVGALPASTVIPTVPTNLSAFTDDLGTNPAHSHSQYLTAHQDISGKQNKVLYGTADPTSDIGVEGDIYVKYV